MSCFAAVYLYCACGGVHQWGVSCFAVVHLYCACGGVHQWGVSCFAVVYLYCACGGVHQLSLHSCSCRLLYDRYLSVHMAFQLRDELIAKAKSTTNLDSKMRKWIVANFEDDANLFRNCQAMRNHI